MEKQQLEQLIGKHYSIRRMADAVGGAPATIRYWLRVGSLKSNGNQFRQTKPLCRNCGKPVRRRPKIYCSIICQQQLRRRRRIEGGIAGTRALKSYLLESREYKCEICGLAEWMGRSMPLELDHKDGDSVNNKLDNLRLICPNCHAQTETYKAKNIGRGRHFRRERYAQGKSY